MISTVRGRRFDPATLDRTASLPALEIRGEAVRAFGPAQAQAHFANPRDHRCERTAGNGEHRNAGRRQGGHRALRVPLGSREARGRDAARRPSRR